MLVKEIATPNGIALISFELTDEMVRATVVGQVDLEVYATDYESAERKLVARLEHSADLAA